MSEQLVNEKENNNFCTAHEVR